MVETPKSRAHEKTNSNTAVNYNIYRTDQILNYYSLEKISEVVEEVDFSLS
jgi:hypothetical protein